VTHFVLSGPMMSGTAEAKVVKFCTHVEYIGLPYSVSLEMTN